MFHQLKNRNNLQPTCGRQATYPLIINTFL